MATAAEGPQQHAAPPHGNQQEAADRLEWVKQMRSAFSPEGMCKADGEVDQDFFKPKNIIIRLKDDEKWGAAQKEALYKVGARGGRAALMAACVRPRVPEAGRDWQSPPDTACPVRWLKAAVPAR